MAILYLRLGSIYGVLSPNFSLLFWLSLSKLQVQKTLFLLSRIILSIFECKHLGSYGLEMEQA